MISDHPKLHRLHLGVKCLREVDCTTTRGSWRKNRNQTRSLKGSEVVEREARNTAPSQILLQSVCSATAESETTSYWVTQNLPLCYTKHHAEQDCLPFPPRCYIWLLPIGLSLKWHMAAELRSVFGWHDNFFSLITTRLEHPNGAIILILQILLVVSWVSHHSSIFLGTPFA